MPAYRQLYEIYVAIGRISSAEAVAKRLIEGGHDPVLGRVMQAELRLRADRREEARELIRQARRIDPDNLDAALLEIMVEMPVRRGIMPRADFDRALARLTDVRKAHPGSDRARRMLAVLLDNPGHEGRSAQLWAEAYAQDPRDGTFRSYLAVLIGAKRYAAAAELAAGRLTRKPADADLR